MRSRKLSNDKEREEHINSLKNEIKNSETNSTKTESKEVTVTTKLNKKYVKIVMDNDNLTEKEVYSKFANNDELHKYIKEKGYREKRKPRTKVTQMDNNLNKLNKIKEILNSEISDTEKINKIKDIFEEDNKIIELKKELSKKEKERKSYSAKMTQLKDKMSKLEEEIQNIKNNIKG